MFIFFNVSLPGCEKKKKNLIFCYKVKNFITALKYYMLIYHIKNQECSHLKGYSYVSLMKVISHRKEKSHIERHHI